MEAKENGLMAKQKQMNNKIMECINKGEDLIFTFKEEAEFFALNNNLEIEYNNGEFIDGPHYKIKGTKSKIYWMAN